MTEFDFLLKFDLPDLEENPEKFVDALYESGCDDATVGIGQHGRIALNFTRESGSAFEAVASAIADVRNAIPGATLVANHHYEYQASHRRSLVCNSLRAGISETVLASVKSVSAY